MRSHDEGLSPPIHLQPPQLETLQENDARQVYESGRGVTLTVENGHASFETSQSYDRLAVYDLIPSLLSSNATTLHSNLVTGDFLLQLAREQCPVSTLVVTDLHHLYSMRRWLELKRPTSITSIIYAGEWSRRAIELHSINPGVTSLVIPLSGSLSRLVDGSPNLTHIGIDSDSYCSMVSCGRSRREHLIEELQSIDRSLHITIFYHDLNHGERMRRDLIKGNHTVSSMLKW